MTFDSGGEHLNHRLGSQESSCLAIGAIGQCGLSQRVTVLHGSVSGRGSALSLHG